MLLRKGSLHVTIAKLPVRRGKINRQLKAQSTLTKVRAHTRKVLNHRVSSLPHLNFVAFHCKVFNDQLTRGDTRNGNRALHYRANNLAVEATDQYRSQTSRMQCRYLSQIPHEWPYR